MANSSDMSYESLPDATTPETQLPPGRYPASAPVVWGVTTLALLIGLTLAVLIPGVLPSGEAGQPTSVSTLDGDSREGGDR
jgi:hypothetical protein